MKFFLARSNQIGEKLREFPQYYYTFFRLSKILVVCMNGDVLTAACGITSLSNYGPVIYVKEEYRRKGLGTKMFEKTIRAARNQGLGFILASASTYNVPSLRLLAKFTFREIVLLKKSNYVILMLPLTYQGELIYAVLHAVCSKLPESLLSYTIDFFMNALGWIRTKTTHIM